MTCLEYEGVKRLLSQLDRYSVFANHIPVPIPGILDDTLLSAVINIYKAESFIIAGMPF
jgi:hypothetical protein